MHLAKIAQSSALGALISGGRGRCRRCCDSRMTNLISCNVISSGNGSPSLGFTALTGEIVHLVVEAASTHVIMFQETHLL